MDYNVRALTHTHTARSFVYTLMRLLAAAVFWYSKIFYQIQFSHKIQNTVFMYSSTSNFEVLDHYHIIPSIILRSTKCTIQQYL